jgi:glucuronide carrier protein
MSAATAQPKKTATKKLSWLNIVGYGSGDFANNVGWRMMSMFLATYYLYIGIPAAITAGIFLFARFFQAIVYLFAGGITDSIKPNKNGKFRRLVLWFGIPMMVAITLMYTIPSNADLAIKVVWAIVTYLLYQLLGALGGVPYGALLGAMTQNQNERQKLSASRMVGGALIGLILTFTLAPQVNSMDPSKLFLPVVAIFCLVGALIYVFLYKATIEQVEVPKQPHVTAKDTLKAVFTNPALLILCFGTGFYLIATCVGSIGPIIAKQVLAADASTGTLALITTLVTLINAAMGMVASPFGPVIARKFGKKGGWYLGCALGIIGGVMFIFVQNVWLALFAMFLNAVGAQFCGNYVWAMEGDTVEYYEWKTGKRTDGAAMAGLSFFRQMFGALTSWLGPAILAFTGYKEGMNVVQDPSVATNLRLACGLVPLIGFVISAVIIYFYPITEQKFKEITAELHKRHAAEDAQAAE